MVPDSTPLVLVFHYRVNTEGLVKGNTFTFENTAELNGKWKNEQCSTSFTSSSGASADIDFNSNRLTIVKYSGTPDKVLPVQSSVWKSITLPLDGKAKKLI